LAPKEKLLGETLPEKFRKLTLGNFWKGPGGGTFPFLIPLVFLYPTLPPSWKINSGKALIKLNLFLEEGPSPS